MNIPLTVENVLWANTVLAAGSAICMVVYTGKETRAVLNTSEPETKIGTLEREVNKMAKVSAPPLKHRPLKTGRGKSR